MRRLIQWLAAVLSYLWSGWGAIASILLFCAVWELGGRVYGDLVLPGPWHTLQQLASMLQSGLLWPELAISTRRVLSGLGLALLLGTMLGLLAGRSLTTSMLSRPLITLLLGMPPIAWLVLAMLWFGMGDATPIFTVFIACFPIAFAGAMQGARTLDNQLQEVAKQLAWNQRDITDNLNYGVLDSSFNFKAINPKIGVIYQVSENWRIYSNFSGSSEAPTFWQLAVSAPNPNAPLDSYLEISDLKMQTAKTFEIGSQFETEFISGEAAWYFARVKDELIAEVKDFAVDGTTVNYDHPTTHRGLELALNARSKKGLLLAQDQISARLVYNWSDFRFDGGRYDGKRVAGVPVHLLFAEVNYQFDKAWGLSVNARWQPTSTYVDHSNSGLKLDAYLLLGAKLVWKPISRFEMFIDARNITNEKYQTAYVVRGFSPDDPNTPTFVPGPEFSFILGMTVKW